MKNKDKKIKKSYIRWYFLIVVTLFYLLLFLFIPDKALTILIYFGKLIKEIIPIFVLVYVVMFLVNYFVDNKVIKKHMGEDAGIKGWIISITFGIISIGPIYAWYPLLHDLQEKGIKNKFIAAFLYNRGIKLQWLPVLILYFGWIYSVILLVVMAFFSIPQGFITEKLIDISSKKNR